MRIQESYDWVTLGDHPGALLSACLAARLGFKTLIVPCAPVPGPLISEGGQCLDLERNVLVGLGSTGRADGLLRTCLRKLQINHEEEDRILQREETAQVITPFKRITYSNNDSEFRYELERELGAEGVRPLEMIGALAQVEVPILGFWNALPERLTIQPDRRGKSLRVFSQSDFWKKLERGLAALGGEERRGILRRKRLAVQFQDLCAGVKQATLGGEAYNVSWMELMHVLVLARSAAGYQGGIHAFRKTLLAIAERSGADIVKDDPCEQIQTEHGRLAGIVLKGSKTQIRVGAGALGCALEHAASKMDVTGKSLFSGISSGLRLRRLKASPKARGWLFTVGLTVHTEAIPPGMADRLVWREPGAPALEIDVSLPEHYGVDEPEHRFVFLRTVLPWDSSTLAPESLRLIAARMVRKASDVMPYLDFHITRVFPDFRAGLEDFKIAYPFKAVEELPLGMRALSDRGIGSKSGIEGLFLATDESYPRLGSLGATVAALEAVAWLAHRNGKLGPWVDAGA